MKSYHTINLVVFNIACFFCNYSVLILRVTVKNGGNLFIVFFELNPTIINKDSALMIKDCSILFVHFACCEYCMKALFAKSIKFVKTVVVFGWYCVSPAPERFGE